jgi:hypothetical protein
MPPALWISDLRILPELTTAGPSRKLLIGESAIDFRLGRPTVTNFIFRCPNTGMNVQHQMEAEASSISSGESFIAVECPACARAHFINTTTFELLGQKNGKHK